MSINPRILGACMVGAALIAGAFMISDFGTSPAASDPNISVVAGPAPKRTPIEVEDKNNNGTPDWREELRTVEPVRLETLESDTYAPPDTLTGTVALNLFKNTLQSEQRGSLGKNAEQILLGAASTIQNTTVDQLYYEKHIVISDDTDLSALRNYGNRIADITVQYSTPEGVENEALILKKAIEQNDASLLDDLTLIINSYKNMRDIMLATPVPEPLVKEHLDLINTYHALSVDISAMQDAFSDPLYAMTRIKRYQDDALGLYNALVNVYTKLGVMGVTWDANDSALKLIRIE